MILGYLVIALFFLAILHFIIDGILAPTEHMIARQKLLSIAVELKNYQGRTKESKDVCTHLYDSTNALVANIPRYTIWNMSRFRHFLRNDSKLRQKIGEKSTWIRENSDDFLVGKRKDISKEADRILAWNSMSWALLVIPVFFTLAFIKKIQKLIDSSVLVAQKRNQFKSDNGIAV
ncbi:hypothetical protein [Alcaligenes faecalis]|uniref:hypothetical protein n=1 Tax=Alcaligenes faecalis TaxID=511 RepID=UPI002932F753|nr:hypothetical protein [Alcaligenes faecalis]MDV2115359.1 hypothetical protein [Alcaligenes faecalis]